MDPEVTESVSKCSDRKMNCCSVCGYKTNASQSMKIHMRTHTGEKPFHCPVCELQFAQKPTRDAHMFNIHDIAINKSFKYHVCDTCGKRFKTKGDYNRHIKLHAAADGKIPQPYQCKICQKIYGAGSSLRYHMARVHGNPEKVWHCSLCDKNFTTKSVLKHHNQQFHLEKPFQCSVCNKQFLFEHEVEDHSRIHSISHADQEQKEVSHYQCKICMISKPTKKSLISHSRIHRSHPPSERPHQCMICEKWLSDRHTLRGHQASFHKDDEMMKGMFNPENQKVLWCCPPCNKTFTKMADFQKHKNLYHHEKPFQCSVCNKQFSFEDDLWHHTKTYFAKSKTKIQ